MFDDTCFLSTNVSFTYVPYLLSLNFNRSKQGKLYKKRIRFARRYEDFTRLLHSSE